MSEYSVSDLCLCFKDQMLFYKRGTNSSYKQLIIYVVVVLFFCRFVF